MRITASGNLQGRAIPEWVGKSADSTPPERVRLRLSLRYEGKDAVTGLKLRKGWHADHITALKDWLATWAAPHGNRESNLQPVNADVNTKKAARENKARKKVSAIQKKHMNVTQSKAKIQSAPFQSRLKPEKGSGFSPSHAAHLAKMKQKAGL